MTILEYSGIFILLIGVDGDNTIDVDQHLELGKKLLAAGQLTEALSHYHAAIGMCTLNSVL